MEDNLIGIGKMEENLISAESLSYSTNGSQGDRGSLVSVSCVHYPTPRLPVGPWIKNIGQTYYLIIIIIAGVLLLFVNFPSFP